MKIVFTSQGPDMDSQMDSRFGRAAYLVSFSSDDNTVVAISNSEVASEAHGAGSATSKKLFELKPDVLITGNGPGETASKVIKLMNIKTFANAHDMTLYEAYEAFKQGKLKELAL